jgi:hypothetical protein
MKILGKEALNKYTYLIGLNAKEPLVAYILQSSEEQ